MKQAIAKLRIARNQIDEVLSISVARYDPLVLSQSIKNDLSVFRDFLNQTIEKLQGRAITALGRASCCAGLDAIRYSFKSTCCTSLTR
jgi:hypothetical protein